MNLTPRNPSPRLHRSEWFFSLSFIALALAACGPLPSQEEEGPKVYLGGRIEGLIQNVPHASENNARLSLWISRELGSDEHWYDGFSTGFLDCLGPTFLCGESFHGDHSGTPGDDGLEAYAFPPEALPGEFHFSKVGRPVGRTFEVEIWDQPFGHFCEIEGGPVKRVTTTNEKVRTRPLFGIKELTYTYDDIHVKCHRALSVTYTGLLQLNTNLRLRMTINGSTSGGTPIGTTEELVIAPEQLAHLNFTEAGFVAHNVFTFAFSRELQMGDAYSIEIVEQPFGASCDVTLNQTGTIVFDSTANGIVVECH